MSLTTVAIVNPMASNGGAGELWPAMREALAVHFPGLQVRFTEARGHATLLCAEALEQGAQRILAVGGDGTNNEVLAGFTDAEGNNRFPEATLAIVAAGTGGDFQRLFGKVSPREQVRRIAKSPVRQIDYGVAEFVNHAGQSVTRPFLNVASIGVSGSVVQHVNASDKRWGPTLTYVGGSVKGILGHRNQQVHVSYDGGPERRIDLTLCAVANGQYFGAGMWICPQAQLEDGLFDVVEVSGMSRRRLLPTLAKVFKGRHLRVEGVETARAQRVELSPVARDKEVLLELDGEQPGRLPATFRVVERGLRLQIATSESHPHPPSRSR